ncbi:unnamed protein product [Caenorhabditis auriculariae]|uniref:Uncharacterized protein n=1 Tax=Caenorhabditis auriculariae TaxID=2777116 RepID=A0A8S1H2K7_9PELO|nr:unnamed protein product [Caenorhabditis auriculariae]
MRILGEKIHCYCRPASVPSWLEVVAKCELLVGRQLVSIRTDVDDEATSKRVQPPITERYGHAAGAGLLAAGAALVIVLPTEQAGNGQLTVCVRPACVSASFRAPPTMALNSQGSQIDERE